MFHSNQTSFAAFITIHTSVQIKDDTFQDDEYFFTSSNYVPWQRTGSHVGATYHTVMGQESHYGLQKLDGGCGLHILSEAGGHWEMIYTLFHHLPSSSSISQ